MINLLASALLITTSRIMAGADNATSMFTGQTQSPAEHAAKATAASAADAPSAQDFSEYRVAC